MPETAQGTFELIAEELAKLLVPLQDHLSPDQIQNLLAEMGVNFPDELNNQAGFISAISNTVNVIIPIPGLIDDIRTAIENEDVASLPGIVENILGIVRQTISSIDQMETAVGNLNVPGVSPAAIANLAGDFALKLLQYLVYTYLEGYKPILLRIFSFTGITTAVLIPGDSNDDTLPDFYKKEISFSNFLNLFSDPLNYFQNLYGWNTGAFDGKKLLSEFHELLAALAIPMEYFEGTATEAPYIEFPFVRIKARTDVNPRGLEFELVADIPKGFNFEFPFLFDNLKLRTQFDASLEAGTSILIQPDGALSITPPSGEVSGDLGVSIVRDNPTGKPMTLLGSPDSSRLTVAGIEAGFNIGVGWSSDDNKAKGSFGISMGLDSGKVVIDLSDGDGFLSSIFPAEGITFDFNFGMGYNGTSGIFFTGSGGLEIAFPLHISIFDVISLNNLFLFTGFDSDALSQELSLGAGISLGPLQATVERMGIKANLKFEEGNLGPMDISIDFKPPTGVGLAIDAGIVKGGGYLYLDPDRGEYAGALELTFSEVVSLKAIGIITTKMPDGSDGFSLLIIITAEFGTGIQLGFGFTLLGVGGLIGLNRTMMLEPIAEGVRSGAIDGIMFPENIIENAPKIISDLKTFFPPEDGTFLIGPMAKLGWGTPTLVSISLGIIIEIPPGNIAILGVLKVALPDEAAELLVLQVNFIGALEVDKERLWFFAAIFESRVLWITIEGEMGLLVDWSDNPNFVVTVGGFHPQFDPPSMPFPNPKRLSISMLDTPVARITTSGYFAVTSNTVQFGSKTEVFFGLDEVNVSGHFGFDILFQFSPFYFIASVSASLSVKVFGMGLFSVSVSGSLEGPTPWRIKGKGKIGFLFFSISFSFDETWGDKEDTTLPTIPIMPLLEAEIKDMSNWKAILPASNSLLVSLREIADTDEIILHPSGYMKISQTKLPLDISVTKSGNQISSDVNKLSLVLAGGQLSKKGDSKESFAIAQFQELEDSTKLDRPAYEKQHSGIEISTSGDDLKTGSAVKRNIRYEQIIIDSNYKRFVKKFYMVVASIFGHFLRGNAVARSKVSNQYKTQLQPFSDKIEVNQNTYSVAFNSNNQPVHEGAASFESEALAREFLNEQIAGDPNLAETLHVIPQHETALAS